MGLLRVGKQKRHYLKLIDPRFVGGLALTGVVVYHLGTAPVARIIRPVEVAAQEDFQYKSLPPIQPIVHLTDFTGTSQQADQVYTQTYDLIYTNDLPLAHRGLDTITNVQVAANAIDMTTLHPGETFSFNNTVGIRSEEKGYKPGLMYASGELTVGVGGGICIVSTMLYNAALETGLKIIDRHPHSGPVSYAEPGRDAAVSYGYADLCFKNNTDSPILLRTLATDGRLNVSFYSKKVPGRTVEIITKDYEELPYTIVETPDPAVPEGQVIVDRKARPGFTVTVVRVIREDGKLVSRETISHDTILPQNKLVRIPVVPGGMVNLDGIMPLPALPNMQLPSSMSLPGGMPPMPGHPGGTAAPSIPNPPKVESTSKAHRAPVVSPVPSPSPSPAPVFSPAPSPDPRAGFVPPHDPAGRNLSNSDRTGGSLPK